MGLELIELEHNTSVIKVAIVSGQQFDEFLNLVRVAFFLSSQAKIFLLAEGQKAISSIDDIFASAQQNRRFSVSLTVPTFARENVLQRARSWGRRYSETQAGVTHEGVICDSCGAEPIKGVRYKSSVVDDFDICENCESSDKFEGTHTPFLKINRPMDDNNDEEDDEEDNSDEEEDSDENEEDSGQEAPPCPQEELKMVMCVRTDLKMGKGKLAAQCCHAAVACYAKSVKKQPLVTQQYNWYGSAKVCLKASDEDTIRAKFEAAKEAGLVAYLVADAGRTQIASGTRTVCGIGPAPKSAIDKITGDLKLL